MLQTVVTEVLFTIENKFAVLAVDLKLEAVVVVMLPYLFVCGQILGAVGAEGVRQLMVIVFVVGDHLLALLALDL